MVLSIRSLISGSRSPHARSKQNGFVEDHETGDDVLVLPRHLLITVLNGAFERVLEKSQDAIQLPSQAISHSTINMDA